MQVKILIFNSLFFPLFFFSCFFPTNGSRENRAPFGLNHCCTCPPFHHPFFFSSLHFSSILRETQQGKTARLTIFCSKNGSKRWFHSNGHLPVTISAPINTQLSCKFLVITTLLPNPFLDIAFWSDRYKVTILKIVSLC